MLSDWIWKIQQSCFDGGFNIPEYIYISYKSLFLYEWLNLEIFIVGHVWSANLNNIIFLFRITLLQTA